jgi:hypothetical protein
MILEDHDKVLQEFIFGKILQDLGKILQGLW